MADSTHNYSVVEENVTAQVAAPRDPDPSEVSVHEVHVTTDKVITDPASPEAVQVPDAGKGALDLPIHQLAGETPAEAFGDADASSDEPAEPVNEEPDEAPAYDES